MGPRDAVEVVAHLVEGVVAVWEEDVLAEDVEALACLDPDGVRRGGGVSVCGDGRG